MLIIIQFRCLLREVCLEGLMAAAGLEAVMNSEGLPTAEFFRPDDDYNGALGVGSEVAVLVLRLQQQLIYTEHVDYPMWAVEDRVTLQRGLLATWRRVHGPEHEGALYAAAQLARLLKLAALKHTSSDVGSVGSSPVKALAAAARSSSSEQLALEDNSEEGGGGGGGVVAAHAPQGCAAEGEHGEVVSEDALLLSEGRQLFQEVIPVMESRWKKGQQSALAADRFFCLDASVDCR